MVARVEEVDRELRVLAELEKQTRLLREILEALRGERDDGPMTVTLRLDDDEPIPLRPRKP